jgi:hypothetical protein
VVWLIYNLPLSTVNTDELRGTKEDMSAMHCMQIRVVSQKIVIENPDKC